MLDVEGTYIICLICFTCRYFSKQELYEMFAFKTPNVSNTQIQLEKMHASQRKTDPDLDNHIAFLKTLGMVEQMWYRCIENDRHTIAIRDFIL